MAKARSQLNLARAEKLASVAAKEAGVLGKEKNNRREVPPFARLIPILPSPRCVC
jgi:hypothetical protein